jgi:hypothetical protein
MPKQKIISNNTKVHTQYYTKDGDNVVGVTTILNVLAKPFLLDWAWNCGLAKQDYRKIRDKASEIGTITHLLVMHHLKHVTPDLSEYSQQNINVAQNCMKSFYEWEKVHKIEPLMLEIPLVSDIYRYGGTPDFIGNIDGKLELIDFKTSKAIYSDYVTQCCAYIQLAKEAGHNINRARILRIGRDDNEGFEERLIVKFDLEFELFKHCLAIYNIQKSLKRG